MSNLNSALNARTVHDGDGLTIQRVHWPTGHKKRTGKISLASPLSQNQIGVDQLMTDNMVAVRLGIPTTVSVRERKRLSGRRGACENCLNCGGLLWLPQDVPDGYGGDLDYTFDCPKCRTVYAAESALPDWLEFELAVLQNEHRGARAHSTRKRIPADSIYRDPIYGDVKRAQDKQAEWDHRLAEALYTAHYEHHQSIRKIALNAGMKKSQVHDIIKRERERRDRLTPRRPATAETTTTASDWDDIPF